MVQDVLLFPLSTFYEYLQKVYYKNVWICQSVQWEVLRNVSSRRWTKNKNKHSLLLWVMICLHRQVDKDCELLEQERIMDYSLLVGIHFKDRCKGKLHNACFTYFHLQKCCRYIWSNKTEKSLCWLHRQQQFWQWTTSYCRRRFWGK